MEFDAASKTLSNCFLSIRMTEAYQTCPGPALAPRVIRGIRP